MLEMDALIAALRSADVGDLARRSGVSTKTIYRIRQRSRHLPNVGTVLRLTGALQATKCATLPLDAEGGAGGGGGGVDAA